MRAAAIQLNSNADKERNLAAAERLVRAAVADGAEFVALPEKWNLLAGSISERGEEGEKASNTSVLVGPDGEDVAVYRKIHMFDVDAGGVSYRESEHERPGTEPAAAPVADVKLGMTVCYDLRFPELFRILALRGARVIAVPSAFTLATGRDHWEVLLRARAIENQLFVVAPNQWGEAPPHFSSFGRSLIADPWGSVLATAADGEGFVAADLDFAAQDRIRESLPSLANRRPGAYLWPQPAEAES